MAQRLVLSEAGEDIWHSTYYTMPPQRVRATVVTVYDMIHERLQHLFTGRLNAQLREQKRRCVMAADAVICISETTRNDVAQAYGLDRSRLCVVPLAPSPVFRPLKDADLPSGPPQDKPFLVYVGDRSHYKNLSCLLQAFGAWPGRREVDLVIVGREWTGQERQQLIDLSIVDAVHLLTGVDDESLCRIYNRAVALVYPSFYEGFGIPVLEAMACGCPVVASRIPSTIEIAGEVPIYFDPAEPADLIRALDQVTAEGRLAQRTRIGQGAVSRYDWNAAAQQTLGVYRTIHGAV